MILLIEHLHSRDCFVVASPDAWRPQSKLEFDFAFPIAAASSLVVETVSAD